MSEFSDRLRLGLDRVHSRAKTDVVYRRGSEELSSITATPGESEFEAEDVESLTTRVRTRDYKIDVADLVFAAGADEPRSGDEIDETIGGVVKTFEVFAPGGAEPSWRYADHARTRYRIHTREIS